MNAITMIIGLIYVNEGIYNTRVDHVGLGVFLIALAIGLSRKD